VVPRCFKTLKTNADAKVVVEDLGGRRGEGIGGKKSADRATFGYVRAVTWGVLPKDYVKKKVVRLTKTFPSEDNAGGGK